MGRNFARLVLQVFGVALLLSGGMWTLQGLGILTWPSDSFMLGDENWALYGSATAVIGAIALFVAERMRR